MTLHTSILNYLFLILICTLALWGCDTGTTVKLDDPTAPIAKSDSWWVEKHGRLVTSLENNAKIIFIGDSITDFWDWDDIEDNGAWYDVGIDSWNELQSRYTKIINLGFSGDKTQNVIWRLIHGEFPDGINPEYVVLMIGTNNTGTGYQPESTAAGIDRIIEIIHSVSPVTNIILLSVFPRGANNAIVYRIINNRVNDIIKTYDGYRNVRYYNFGQYYINPNGTIKRELYNADLLHLSASGYDLWKDKLIEIIG